MNDRSRLQAVAVALDTDDWPTFERWCDELGPRVGVLKVGLEAFVRWSRRAVDTAKRSGARIFLDLKLHDIPNTVAGAVASAADLGVDYLTLHASGGQAMMEAAVEASSSRLQLLAVTVLTHHPADDAQRLGWSDSLEGRVLRLGRIARDSGCSGMVCSPRELSRLRIALPAPFLLVTPGIRLQGGEAHDQARVATPESARADGADLLVIGRALTRSADAEATLREIRDQLNRRPGSPG